VRLVALIAVPLLASATLAHAQAFQCRVSQAPISVPTIIPDGPARSLPITGYTLALTWAPEYCRGKERSAADRVECSGDYGRFGLVVHGLWPESRGKDRPQWCPTARRPSPELIRRNLCMTPSSALLAHEWAKHGACMAKTPESYFALAGKMWAALTPPDLDLLARGKATLTAGKVRQAFVDANPAFRPEQIGLLTNERGWLKEIRLCYSQRFAPARCAKTRFGPADNVSVKLWRGL
jgi:ribonuclease T2